MKRTSYGIQRKVGRLRAITVHISPYEGGLAPETRNYFAYLNDEAVRLRTGVRFTALANRVEATGDIERAARTPTLGGWAIRRAIQNGYDEGPDGVLRRGNSQWRQHLRRHAKTKAGMAEAAAITKAETSRESFLRSVTGKAATLHDLISAIPKAERDAEEIFPGDFKRPAILHSACTNWPMPAFRKKHGGKGRPPTKTSFKKGGPNPRRRIHPDS